jgi:hypothetical protein
MGMGDMSWKRRKVCEEKEECGGTTDIDERMDYVKELSKNVRGERRKKRK